MRSVTYKSVQDMVAGFLGWDPANLSTDEQATINRAFNRRAQFAWDAFFWPELTPCERRLFRPAWSSATTYAAQAEVFYLASKKYYCALQASTNQPPADANGVTNLAYWADSQGRYSAAENYASTTAYVQGSQVYYPNTDALYQLYAASATGVAPSDATKWGVLVPFQRNIGYTQAGQTVIGEVKQVWEGNPRIDPEHARPVDFVLQDNGVRALGLCPIVYVEFRTTVPSWSGTLWAAGSYAAGAQVYFNGDYYQALQTATTQDPTMAAYWAVIPVPYVLAKYIANGAYADVDGKSEGGKDAFPSENDEAYSILEFEFDKIERQQQQSTQLNVRGNKGGF